MHVAMGSNTFNRRCKQVLDLAFQLVLAPPTFIREEHQVKDMSTSLRSDVPPPGCAAQGRAERSWLEVTTWIMQS